MKRLCYAYLKLVVSLAIRVYFRKIEINGDRKAGHGKAAMYAVRHSNALMDPLIVSPFVRRTLHFLARADVFANKFVARLLDMINMMPVYRIRDGWSSMDRNDETFARCRALLARGRGIQIFPEGVHSGIHRLLPLKKGTARILLPTLAENPEMEIDVVPVGLNYTDERKFRASVSLNFGTPLRARAYFDADDPESSKQIVALTLALQEALRVHVLDLREPAPYETADALRLTMEMETHGVAVPGFADSKQLCEEIVAAFSDAERAGKLEALAAEHAALRAKVNYPEAGLPAPGKAGGPGVLGTLLLALLAPVIALGMLLHSPVLLLANLTPRLVKDPIFYSAIRMITGMFTAQGLYLVYFVVAWCVMGHAGWAALVLLGIVLSGVIALWGYDTGSDLRRGMAIKSFVQGNPEAADQLTRLQAQIKAVLRPSGI